VNTKILMTSSSLILGLAGIFALFAPDNLSAMLGVTITKQLSVLIQLMGALYFSFALMNWSAKNSTIGGIYARPVSLGNFTHFFIGTLLLAKYQLSNEINIPVLLALVVYVTFASIFYWLVFLATAVKAENL